jgi:hypothetical protein
LAETVGTPAEKSAALLRNGVCKMIGSAAQKAIEICNDPMNQRGIAEDPEITSGSNTMTQSIAREPLLAEVGR